LAFTVLAEILSEEMKGSIPIVFLYGKVSCMGMEVKVWVVTCDNEKGKLVLVPCIQTMQLFE